MAKWLDTDGVSYLWNKIKELINEKLSEVTIEEITEAEIDTIVDS